MKHSTLQLDGIARTSGIKRKKERVDDSFQSNRSGRSTKSCFSEISDSWDEKPVELSKPFPKEIVRGIPLDLVRFVEQEVCSISDLDNMPNPE